MAYNPVNPNGQATSANSSPVVVASDQSAIAVSANAANRPTTTTMQNGATANGNGTSLPVTGYATALLNIVSSPAMSGGTTVNFEASVDDTTWVSINAHTVGANTISTTTTADGDYRINSAGYKSIRARISGYSAGTVTIKGYTVANAGPVTTVNANLVGSSIPTTVMGTASSLSVTPIQANAASLNATVTGTVTANAGTGSFTVAQATPGNLLVTPVQANASSLNVTVANTVTIGGVTGTASSLSMTPIQANAASLYTTAQLQSGTGVTIGSTLNALDVNLKAGSAASVFVTPMQANASSLNVSVGNTVTVSGTVTANAGTGSMNVTAYQGTAGSLKAQVQQLNSVSSTVTLQNAVSATGNGTNMSVDGYATVILEVTGSFTGIVSFKGSRDGGTTFYAIRALQLGTSTYANTTTGTGLFEASVAGLTHVQTPVNWTSGTSVTVIGTAVPVSYGQKVVEGSVSVSNSSFAVTQSGAWTTAVTGTPASLTTAITGTASSVYVTAGVYATASSLNATVAATSLKSPAGQTPVADATNNTVVTDVDKMLMVKLNTAYGDLLSQATNTTGSSSTALSTFGTGASIRNYVTAYSLARTDSGTSPMTVDFQDGSGGTTLWTVVVPAGGGAHMSSPVPMFRTSANTGLFFKPSASVTTLYISASGFQSKV